MNKHSFPYFAVGMGLFLWFVIMIGGRVDTDGATKLPLLTLLVISEFAFIITAIGTYLTGRDLLEKGMEITRLAVGICCVLLAVRFLISGINFWPL